MSLASTVNLNATTPAAPSGEQNILFADDGGTPTVNVSASDPPMVGDTGSGGTGETFQRLPAARQRLESF